MADQVAIVGDGGIDSPNQAGYCLRVGISGTSAGSSGSTTSSDWVGSSGTAYGAHGYANNCPTNLDTSQQSALGFTPRALTAITPETPFNLGSMRHINGPIASLTYKWYKGNLVVRFNGLDLTFPWTMWETPTQVPCPNGATGACPDETRFTSLAGNQTFTIDGVPYTLVLLGFTNNGTNSTCAATPGGTYTNDFWTPESATTFGCLYASVKQVRTLKIQKVVAAPYGAPATYPASAFTASSDTVGSAWGSAFSLTPTGTGPAGQAVKAANLVTGQTVNISETAPTDPGWAFTSLSCADGGGNATITGLTVSGAGLRFSGDYSAATGSLAPITCTYTNTYTPRATLTLVKQVTTAGQTGTLASAADWTLSAAGSGAVAGQSVSGASGSAAVTAKSVIAGTYSLAEVGSNAATTAGYVQDGAWTCTAGTLSGATLTLAAGQSATCTVRNKFAVGKLVITKTVTGAGYTGGTSKAFTAAYTCTSGTATVKSGTVTVHPAASNGTAGATATIDDVPAGATCSVTEANPPTGTSTDLVNPSWSWSAPINPAAVTVAADTTSTVNITNGTTRQLGSLQLTTAISPRAGVPGAGYTGGAARTFGITYSCTLVGTVVSSGTVNVSTGTPVTIAGVPATSSCSVSTEDQAQKSGDFLDPSYAWDNYTAGAAVTIQNNNTATIGVSNYFRRDTVSLNIAKVVTGNGYSGTAKDFTVAYDCGAPYTGTVTVAAGGTETVTVPAGVACTVSEKAPAAGLLKPGYVWGDATYAGLAGGTIAVTRPGPGTVTITNPTSIGYGRIQVRKSVDSFAAQVASGTVFTLGVSCDAAAQGTADNFAASYNLTWPSTTTALTPYLPVGTSCTVTETDAPTGHDALPNASYDWKAKPDAATVKVPAAEDPRIVTVTNDIARVYGQLTIAKDVVNHTGLGTGGFHFSGTYRCDYNNGEDIKSGTWAVTGQGQAATVDVLVGSSCTVTEDNPGSPVPGDRSYTWSTQTPDPTTVGKPGATATVVNTLNRAEGSFNVAKSVEGGTAGNAFPAGADFGFSYTCTPATGDPITGTLSVNAGDSKAPGDAVPGGSTCTVTESDFPGTLDPYRWDGVSLSVNGDAGHATQDGRSITFTTTDDAQPVSVRVVNSISAKTAQVVVSKKLTGETGGYTAGGDAIFPVTLTCTGAGGQGTRTVAADGSTTFSDIPLGATCSATEGSTTAGLRDGSYAWEQPAIGDPVKLTDPGASYDIHVTNPIKRVYAGIEIAKVIDDGGFAGVLDPSHTFSGTWSCTYGSDDAVTGTWQGQGSAAGSVATPTGDATHILIGSDCTVAEDAGSLGVPSSDPSYRWDATPKYHNVTVEGAQANRLTVTNTLQRDTGKVRVTKELGGQTAGYAPSGSFAGFSVTARCYLNDPAETGHLEATVAVRPGETQTVLDQVPYGWTCQVGEGSFPNPSQLRDASFAWDGQSVAFPGGGTKATVTAANDAPTATITNSIRRVTGGLAISKAFGDGTAGAVKPGTTFSGGYHCTYGSDAYTGTWTVTGTGPATLTGDSDIPFTAHCTATENDPSDGALIDTSYTWAKPDLGGTVTIASAAEPAQLVVTNTATRRWSGLEVTTAYAGAPGGFASGLSVAGAWSCTYRGQVAASGSWTLPASGGTVVLARPADAAIPAESSCVVTENSLAAADLVDSSWAWQPTTYSPAGGSVSTNADKTARVSVTNDTVRLRQSFTVTKHLLLGSGVVTSALEGSLTFSGKYRCAHAGDGAVTGSWGPVAANADWTSPPLFVGSDCTVTGEDDPAAASNVDDSYVWGTPDLGQPVTIPAAGQPRPAITVGNPVHRITGSFGVIKEVTGDTEGIDAAAVYGFTWSCTAANGNTFPANGTGTFGLTAGGTWSAPDGVPVGSSCQVTEATPPAPSDASYTWSTTLDVANATGTVSGRRVSFTLPRTATPVAVTATNRLTRAKGGFSVAKSSDPVDGSTVVPGQAIHYTVTVTGDAVGFTNSVVVTDALAGVLANADVTDISASQGAASLTGTDLVWTVGTVRASSVLTLTYTATVKAGADGVTLTNTVSATGETNPAPCGAACTTTHHTPAWTLAKSSNPAGGAVVVPGDTVTYTLTATNTSDAQVLAAKAADDLTGVLADADVTFTSPQLSRSGNTLTWAIPTMAKGGSATVSYTARVKAGADGATLTNTVRPIGAGGSCAGACSTTQGTSRWSLAKTSSPASGAVVKPGDTLTYTLAVTNTGPVPVTGATVTDDVSDLVDDATLGTLPAGITRAGTRLTWTVPTLAAGESRTISYTAVVKAGALGATLRNTAAPAGTGGHCDTSCSTVATTPAWTLAKSSSVANGATVKPGDVVGYTLTVANTGPVTLHGASVTDDLSDVLDDAVLGSLPAGAALSGSTLTWPVPDVAPGGHTSVSYQATIKAGADGATLRNAAIPATTGGTCVGGCATTAFTPQWTLAKTADPASGSIVAPGDAITYTLTATNTSSATVAAATAVDDLASVVANADVAFTSSQLSRSGSTLTWAIPTLAPGATATVSYTATLRPGATGITVTNSVTPVGAGGSCAAGCSTSQSTSQWGLTKTSTPATGAVVKPGDTVTYTLTAVNEGPVPVSGATVADDVSGLVDDTTLATLPSGVSRTGNQLTWAVPTIPVGGIASVTYSAVVHVDARGATITNSAAPVGTGGHCTLSCSTSAYTDAWTLTKASDPADGASVTPGTPIGYTLTVTNTGGATLHGARVTDDLADVLDDATLGTLPSGASLSGSTLTWNVPDVAAGATATLTYTATVTPTATGATLRNSAAPASVGGACGTSCTTTVRTGAWTLAKASSPVSGTVVKPGDVITYTLTATNTSAATVTGVTAVDDLSQVLPNAGVTFASAQLSRTGNTLTWAIPPLAPGQTRTISYTATVTSGAIGVTIANAVSPRGAGGVCTVCTSTHSTAAWTLAKTSSPSSGSVVIPGEALGYTLTVTNTGPAVLAGAVVTDDVSGLVDDATLAVLPAGLTRSGATLTWSVPAVPVGGTASITYRAQVNAGASGAILSNTAAAASAGGSCGTACSTTSYTPSWALSKTSDPASGATVHPGDTVGYTLTVTNTGPAVLHGALVDDDLADVLDNATLLAVPADATLTGTTLTWAVGDVAPGASAILTYRVSVGASADGVRLANTATPASAGGRCSVSCTTLNQTPAWRLAKTADPASGSVVKPGDVITYTLTATNTGPAAVTGATATDDLAGVLAAADVTATSPQLTRSGATLTWSIPTLAKGATATVTYTARIRAGADGATITNSATPNGQGGSCGAGCSTSQTTAAWSLAKTSDAAPGAILEPGRLITYTLTVHNTGPVPLTGATVDDDASGLIDDADLGVLPAGLSRVGSHLTWAVPAVPAGGAVSTSYGATIKASALGATLTNTATPTSAGGRCDVCTTTQYTPKWSLVKGSSVGLGATVRPGDVVDYTLTVSNDGPATLHSALVVDDATDVLDDATLVAVPAGATRSGGLLTWSVPDVAPGATATLTYRVVVDPDATGATLRNQASPVGIGGTCGLTCTTVAHTPSWTLEKTSDPVNGAIVHPGDLITYTLTATNTSEAEIRGALALDDVSKVTPYATLSFSSPELSRTGDLLTWAIPTLAKGDTATVTYTARVAAGADGVAVHNSVSPIGAGGSCVGGCATTQSTGAWTLTKTSDPASGSQVLPGDQIHYTLTVANTGFVPVDGALVTDDLNSVVNNAIVTDLGPGLTRTGTTLVWDVPTVAAGGSASVGYTATVAAGSIGATLTNTAAPASSGGHCLSCTTTQTTPSWTLAKTSTPADGATVVPGDVIGYTLTVTNTGSGRLTGAVVADDLSDVLDDATLGTLPAGATRSGNTLTWQVPDVPAGATAALAYTVRISADAVGATLRNAATAATAGGTCASSCTTMAHTPSWTLTKTSDPGDGAAVIPGDVISYTLTATNTSAAVISGATAVDDLSRVTDDADVTATAAGLSLAGQALTWTIPTLQPGTHASVTYTAIVRADGATITNTVVPTGAGGSCTACTTTQVSPAWTLAKSSTPASGAVVAPGDVLGYTLTVVNTGPVPLTGAVVKDDVSGLVDDATLAALPAAVTLAGTELTWAVPTVPVGGTAQVTYSATVAALGATITNAAAPATAGGHCIAGACTTTAYTPRWTLTKDSTPLDATTVAPGGTIDYRLVVTNTGPVTLHGAIVADELADVLDDAVLGALPPELTLSGTRLTWAVPDVAPGATTTVAYRVLVSTTATGATVHNVAVPVGVGGSCLGACSTTQFTGSWSLAKTSDRPDGAVVEPGDQITYTLVATNTSAAVVAGAQARDDLSAVLDDATLGFSSSQLTRAGTTLTWAIPNLAPGGSAAVSYTVRVRDDARGATLTNSVSPVGTAGACTVCSTTQYTDAWRLVKSSDPANGTVVAPGDTIDYTLAVTNDGPVTLTGAQVTDDVSGLSAAGIGALPPGLTRTGDTLTWSLPPVAPGDTATMTYTATVSAGSRGATLVNTASPATVGGKCTSCTTTQTTPRWSLVKTSSPGDGATVVPGDALGYLLTVTNDGPAVLHDAVVTDDLTDVLDDATLATLPAGASLNGTTLTWQVPDVAPGATATLPYAATVKAGAVGATLHNTAAPASVGGACAGCATTQYTAAWTLAKTSDRPDGAVVEPGDVIRYTLTASNTSAGVVSGARALDNLAGVVDDGTLSFASSELSRTGNALIWAIPALAPGATTSVTYAVTVHADGATLTNTVTPDGSGGTCTTCTTTQYTPSWTLAKTSDPASGAVVQPGDVISYTLTVTNTGPVPVVAAVVSDDLSDILDDATLGDLAPDLSAAGRELTWRVPAVPVGGTVHVSYPVTVGVGALGVSLTNKASASTPGGSCAACTTTATTAAWTLAKTSSVSDGATVVPGDVLGYRLSVTNTAPATLTGAVVTDNLADVLDDADLGVLPAGAVLAGTTLTWTVPPVAAGATITLDYSATVRTAALGATLRNTAAPASVGGACATACVTTAHTPAWTLTKTSDPGDGATVVPGSTITYTLIAANTSDAEITGATATDDLSGVLGGARVTASSSELSLDGTLLTWTIPTLVAHETRTVAYTARVLADGATITNTVTPVGVGGTCTACSTTAHTAAWTLAKTSDIADGAQVVPGDVLHYTLTVTNTGPATLSGAVVSDDVSGLAGATLGTLPSGITRAGDALTWQVPDVPAGATASVTYAATVNPDANGLTLANTAAPASAGGSCPGTCSTTAFTPKWSLAKTSDADGATVRPGDVVGYTLTVTNQATSALTGAVVTDDLADVLDDAALVALPAGASLDGTKLTWAVPAVPVGGTATLSYQARLNPAAIGATVRNTAAAASPGGGCADTCSTAAYTTSWTLAKTSDPGSGATVEPGDRVTYTLTVANTGPVALTGAVVTDDMSDLLDDADITGDLPGGASLAGDVLTWSVPEVPVGGTSHVSYTVTVRSDAYGITLGNVATGEGASTCRPGANPIVPIGAEPSDECHTRHYSPAWTLEKTSDPASGSTVEPGSTITFTLRVRNTSQAVVAHAVVTDDLAALLAAASIGALPGVTSLAGSTLTWRVPTLQPGEEAVLTYTAVVGGDSYNLDIVSPATPGVGGSCPVVCTTELLTTPAAVDPTHDDGGHHGGGGTSGDSSLAYTGGDLGALGVGVVFLCAGAGILVVSRRRRTGEE